MKVFSGLLAGIVILGIAAYIGTKVVVGAVNFPLGAATVNPESLHSHIQLPKGFSFVVYGDDIPNARELRLTERGDLLVANPNRDQIVLLTRDDNGDGRYDQKKVLLEKLSSPNGMDFYRDDKKQSWLYVAEEDAIGRVRFDHSRGELMGTYERVVTGLPGGSNHWKKSLRFGPDGRMYVTFGSSCNVCVEKDKRRATLMRYQPDGSGEEIYAGGLRNSEGFDWNAAGELFATDNGRDLLGDDFPPCELNKVEQGKFYGWPFVNGDNVPDPDYGKGHEKEVADAVAPVHGFRAHNAPLGIAFLKSEELPADYHQAALVALHGSWNRTQKDGYKVVSLHWQVDGTLVEKDFMSGFLQNDKAIGRPTEIVEGANGDIFISDDYAGAIYRVRYGGAH